MREILFRGKQANKKWIYGSLLKVTYDGNTYNLIFSDNFLFVFGEATAMEHAAVDPATVGQYTGLTDKNGKKIFEGDIVKGLFLFGMEIKAVVAFQDGAFGLQWNRGSVKEFSAFTSICNVKYEIVGNIHDNPELLGVQE